MRLEIDHRQFPASAAVAAMAAAPLGARPAARAKSPAKRFAADMNRRSLYSAREFGCEARVCRLQPLPIRMPAARTSAPPTMTFAAADSGGVSMKRHWIQEMVNNSTATTQTATIVAV